MSMSHTVSHPLDIPSGLLSSLMSMSNQKKLAVISMLSDSMLHSSIDSKEATVGQTEHTRQMLDRFCGAWKDARVADEINAQIKEHFSCKEPIEL